MKIFKQKKEVISKEDVWCGYHAGYLYMHESFFGLICLMITEWESDKHIVG